MPHYCYVNVPVADMRAEPSKGSEVVSQAYYSEQVEVLAEENGWTKIVTVVDNYQGWTPANALYIRPEFYLPIPTAYATINRCAAHLYGVPDTVYGPLLTLPFESRLQVIDPGADPNSRWIKVSCVNGQVAHIQRGDISLFQVTIKRSDICSFSMQFSGLPYTWGGRSSFGYDCSGFVQMLYRQMGIYIPRDAKDQIQWEGFKEITIDEMGSGDLIFFGLNRDKICHVGMYLGASQFIHATVAENAPYIHTSHITASEWNGTGKWTYCAGKTLRIKF